MSQDKIFTVQKEVAVFPEVIAKGLTNRKVTTVSQEVKTKDLANQNENVVTP